MKKFLLILLGSAGMALAQRPQEQPIVITSIASTGDPAVIIEWEGAIPPYKIQAVYGNAGRHWVDISYHIYGHRAKIPNLGSNAFFRVRTVRDITAPPPLNHFRATIFSPGYVLLQWDSVGIDPLKADNAGGTGYRGIRIFRNGVFLVDVPFPAPQYVDVTAQQGEVYNYTATAVDEALNQSAVSGVRVVIPDYTVTLAWDANPEPDIAGYLLHWGFVSGQYAECFDVGNVLQYTFTMTDYEHIYYFAVSAYNTSGLFGPPSNEVSYRVPLQP